MKTKLLYLLLFITCFTNAQTEVALVYFKDKPNASAYLNNPKLILSEKALQRRSNQSIQLNETDAPIHQDYILQLKQVKGVSVLATSKWFNAVYVQADLAILQNLISFSFVSKIKFFNKNLQGVSKKLTTSSTYVSKWDNQNVTSDLLYGNGQNQIQLHNGNLLHNEGFKGNGITIAVFDTGFPGVDKTKPFEKLRNEGKILGGYNFVSRNENFYTGHNHGTRVLSCMGAYAEGQLIGTAPEANFYLFITEDAVKETPLEEALWVEAAEHADSLGVDIINSSLGYNTFQNSAYNYTYNDLDGKTSFIAQGLDMAFSKGMLIVNSAGNEGDNVWRYIVTPADAKNALTVGAVDNVGVYAPFSSIGPTSDNRIKPNVVAQGQSAVVAYDTGVIATSNGTSFSAPIMSGMVACLWQAFPHLSNKAIFDLVVSVSNRKTLPDNNYGYGIPDFSKVINTLSVIKNPTLNFSIYPNPFNESIVLEGLVNQHDNLTLTVTDINGRIIYQIKNIKNQLQINTQGWCSGTYLICLSSNEGLNVNKFIKN